MDKYRLLAERGAVYIAGGAGSDDSAVMCPTPLSRQKIPVFSTSENPQLFAVCRNKNSRIENPQSFGIT